MKTLDEVITALEGSARSGVKDDAIAYLKAYKDDREDLTALRAFWAESQANPPLTWDELKDMEGKPVWITWTVRGEWHHGDWNLVHAQDDQKIWFADGNGEVYDLWQEYQGQTWKAYRKERKCQ